jgi:4-aminobutyrate aminotransferase-like enzyme
LRHGIRPAALLTDTIFSSDGVFADPPGFLAPAVDAIRNAGGLFIADEVQAGFGRTGDAMWGFQRHKLLPDIVTMGKPMGNGHPIAGVVLMPDVVAEFGARSRYFNTFGGNPVSCAAGMAVLDVIADQGLVANARTIGQYLRERIAGLKHDAIVDVRGAGMFLGVEIARGEAARSAEATARIVNGMRERRVLISATGPRANVLKIRPPLIFTRENADQLADALGAALAAL